MGLRPAKARCLRPHPCEVAPAKFFVTTVAELAFVGVEVCLLQWSMSSVSKVCLGPSTAAVAQIVGDRLALRSRFTILIIRKAFATRESVFKDLQM